MADKITITNINQFNDFITFIINTHNENQTAQNYSEKFKRYRDNTNAEQQSSTSSTGQQSSAQQTLHKYLSSAEVVFDNKVDTQDKGKTLVSDKVFEGAKPLYNKLLEELRRKQTSREEIKNTEQYFLKEPSVAKWYNTKFDTTAIERGSKALESFEKSLGALKDTYTKSLKALEKGAENDDDNKKKRALTMYRKGLRAYYMKHKIFFSKYYIRYCIYLDKYKAWIDKLLQENTEVAASLYHESKAIYDKYNNIRESKQDAILTKIDDFYNDFELKNKSDNPISTSTFTGVLQDRLANINNSIKPKYIEKTKNLYPNRTNRMLLILDSKFLYIYILKIIIYGFIWLALFFTEKIFTEKYMKTVYANKSNPPSLYQFYGIYLGFITGFTAFVVVVSYLLQHFINKSPFNLSYAFNNDVILAFLLDYAIFTILSGIILVIVASVIVKKKYFKYKTEGMRGIRAYKEVMVIVLAVLIMFPYFMLV